MVELWIGEIIQSVIFTWLISFFTSVTYVVHVFQGKYCHNCRRIGHLAKYCLKEHLNGSQEFKVCLRCGDAGHDMPLCMNDYPPDDMKACEIF